MSDVRSQLTTMSGIRELAPEVLDALVTTGRVVDIPRGWTPIHQQEPADKAYVVLTGRLCVQRDGREIAGIGRGELAGEMGLVDHRLRNAQLTADEPVTVLAWPRDTFQNLRQQHPDFDRVVRESAQARHEQEGQSR